MTCTEDQFREILRAEAADITADSVPALSLAASQQASRRAARGPSRLRGRRLSMRLLAPLGAAAAVVAVIAASVAIMGGDRPRPAAPAIPPVLRQLPPYYMYLDPSSQYSAVIRSTTTGAMVATVLPPRSDRFIAVSGARDDRTFALSVAPRSWSPPKSCSTSPQSLTCQLPVKQYLARFNPVQGTVTLRALPIAMIHASDETIALSPSGTELAVATVVRAGNVDVTQIRAYSLPSGNVKAWQDRGSIMSVAWAPNGQLAFDWAGAKIAGNRMLNTNTAGGSLVAASRLIVNYQQPGHYILHPGYAVSGDGTTIIIPVIRSPWRNRPLGSQVRWYSVATGRETRAYTPPPAVVNELWQVLWTDSSGRVTVLRRTVSDKTDRHDYFGVLSGNKFVPIPLPIPAAQADFFFSVPIAF
jgi:hypothetical protein